MDPASSGRIARVDVSTRVVSFDHVKEEDATSYIGGAGVAAAMFAREVSPEIDAYDPANAVFVSVGPFCGTAVPFCGRHFMISKSPLTDMMGESSAGGFFGKELKCAGFDHLVITGKSDEPVYLWVHDGAVEVRDASKLWGLGTRETEAAIKQELGDEKVLVASIGPAGEHLVRYAAVINEEDRAAGRTGMGAVLGSKKVKAIAVRGTGKAPVADPDALREKVKEIQGLVKESMFAGVLSTYGTPSNYSNEAIGDIPVKNFTMSRWKGNKSIDHETLAPRRVGNHGCFSCPVRCTGMVEYEGRKVKAPEYETLAMLGSSLLVDDIDALIRWNGVVNDLGMDTISLGACVAGLLEAIERGLIDGESLGFAKDAEPWGNVAAIEKLFHAIARRDGAVADLADGIKRFVEARGLPAELATHGKGLEVPAHEPRCNNMTALDYATTPRGAYHCYLPMSVSSNMNFKKEIGVDAMVDRFSKDAADGKSGKQATVDTVIKIQDASEAYSSCGGCIFGFQFLNVLSPWVNALAAITGKTWDVTSWVAAGTRLFSLKRAYNLKCGTSKADDTLGPRFFTPIDKGGTKKNVPPLEELLPLYYAARGWSTDGTP